VSVSVSLTTAGTATKNDTAADPVTTRRAMRCCIRFITTANHHGSLPISMVDLRRSAKVKSSMAAFAQYSIASISGDGSSINAQNRSRMAVVILPGAPSPSASPSSVTIGVTPPAVVTAISSSASYSS
jgi:hypothetical protein